MVDLISAVKSPEEYADDLEALAESTSFPKPHLQWLARYLKRRDTHNADAVVGTSPVCDHDDFVQVLDIESGECHHPIKISLHNLLRLANPPNMIFLYGQPCALWLRSLGAKFGIDAEFFARHMERSPRGAPEQGIIFRTLPSGQRFLRLRINTVGSRRPALGPTAVSEDSADELRTHIHARLQQCIKYLQDPTAINTGDSMLRDFHIHDEVNFSFDQYISIYVKQIESHWMVVVWFDMGRDLSQGRFRPLFNELTRRSSLKPRYYTAPQILHMAGRTARPSQPSDEGWKRVEGSNQSIIELCARYGDLVDSQLAKEDIFYAIHPLLKFAAATELNFLSLIEARLQDELEPLVLAGRNFNLSTLLHTKKSLILRTYGLSSNIRFIQSYQDLDWPKIATENSKGVRKIVEDLRIDFEDLAALTHALIERCNEAILLIQAVVGVRQADRAMAESHSLNRLTVLAFFFVPLSFTTSVFGMNIRNFSNQNSLSIWIWIAVAVPVALISSLLLYSPTLTVLQRWLSKLAALKSV